jgi:hypothetical protein
LPTCFLEERRALLGGRLEERARAGVAVADAVLGDQATPVEVRLLMWKSAPATRRVASRRTRRSPGS